MGKIKLVFRRIYRRSPFLPGPTLDRASNPKPIPLKACRTKLSGLNSSGVSECVGSSGASEKHVKTILIESSVKGPNREEIEAWL